MDVSSPISPSEAWEAKTENIIEIGVDFSGMIRVFEKDSYRKITCKLKEFFRELPGINKSAEFDIAHDDFCDWFTQNIHTAERRLRNGRIQVSRVCSYGHGAKVLDIAAKVYVYYCNQPSPETAQRLIPMLHSALDTPMMLLLNPAQTTIQQVDRDQYKSLQAQVQVASKLVGSGIHPVQYDDVMWRRIQRSVGGP